MFNPPPYLSKPEKLLYVLTWFFLPLGFFFSGGILIYTIYRISTSGFDVNWGEILSVLMVVAFPVSHALGYYKSKVSALIAALLHMGACAFLFYAGGQIIFREVEKGLLALVSHMLLFIFLLAWALFHLALAVLMLKYRALNKQSLSG